MKEVNELVTEHFKVGTIFIEKRKRSRQTVRVYIELFEEKK